MGASRLLRLTQWTLREPALRRVSYLVFFVLVFSLVSSVARPMGSVPETVLGGALSQTATSVVRVSYPFLFALVAILATLSISVQREAGGLAALHTLGFRRWQVIVAHTFAIHVLLVAPAMLALLILPLLVEPRLALAGNLAQLFPAPYWASMPRLLMSIVFLSLFAVAFVLLLRRPAVAFGALVTFFFIGWFLQGPLGAYAIVTPPGAFRAAYLPGVFTPAGIPLDGGSIYILYLLAAVAIFGGALVLASRRGESV